MTGLDLPAPYLLFIGDITDPIFAKTAFGIRDWAPERCTGEYGCNGGKLTLGLPVLSPREARTRGARATVIGVASIGGILSPSWIPYLVASLEAGLDIISGMHRPLAEHYELKDAAERHGCRLIDVRRAPPDLPVGTGRKRSGKRVLTVGTDCAVGKKYTALALTRALRARGIAADFRATGQTGIIIAGAGIAVDAVVSDFVSGAAEVLTPDAEENHWDVIEGQGSLFHPSYAGVSLGLLHGSQPDVFVLCHRAGRTRTLGLTEDYMLPSLDEAVSVHLLHARRTNPVARCGGISLNTAHLSAGEAEAEMDEASRQTSLPCADPVRGGARFEALVTSCLTA
jgi:uncharacterized NAD-dependent epimerase/dehydratase family protein